MNHKAIRIPAISQPKSLCVNFTQKGPVLGGSFGPDSSQKMLTVASQWSSLGLLSSIIAFSPVRRSLKIALTSSLVRSAFPGVSPLNPSALKLVALAEQREATFLGPL